MASNAMPAWQGPVTNWQARRCPQRSRRRACFERIGGGSTRERYAPRAGKPPSPSFATLEKPGRGRAGETLPAMVESGRCSSLTPLEQRDAWNSTRRVRSQAPGFNQAVGLAPTASPRASGSSTAPPTPSGRSRRLRPAARRPCDHPTASSNSRAPSVRPQARPFLAPSHPPR